MGDICDCREPQQVSSQACCRECEGCDGNCQSVTLWFVEIRMHGIWTAVGEGQTSQQDAEWSLATWRQENECYRDSAFRVREHTLAAPPPYGLDDDWCELKAEPPQATEGTVSHAAR